MSNEIVIAIDETVIRCFYLAIIAVFCGINLSGLLWIVTREEKRVITTIVPTNINLMKKGLVLLTTIILIVDLLIVILLGSLIRYQNWAM